MCTPTRPAVTVAALSAALLAYLAACGAPTQPSLPPVNQPAAGPQTTASLSALLLEGPERLTPGQTAQFTGTLRYTDGSTRDVTAEAGWSSVRPDIVSISPAGLATATTGIQFPATDSGDVTAALHTRTFQEGPVSMEGYKSLLVLPAGTHRLDGEVRDGGAPARSFLVQITAGRGAGTSIPRCEIQGKCGGFVFYGVAGPTEIRVTKDGYRPVAKTLDVKQDDKVEFDLVPESPRPDVSGRWVMTAFASDGCSSALPPELRTRRYVADISQNGARLDVVLTGASFVTSDGMGRAAFDGHIDVDGVTFRITRGAGDGDVLMTLPKVLEQLTATSFVSVGGYVEGRVSSGAIAGAMDGEFVMVNKVNGTYIKSTRCAAIDHRVLFAR